MTVKVIPDHLQNEITLRDNFCLGGGNKHRNKHSQPNTDTGKTRSSAVTEKLRDASYRLSVFNSSITRAHSTIIRLSLRLQIYRCVELNAVLLSSA